MKCKVSVSFTVPQWAYMIFKDISLQNTKVDFSINENTKEITFSADMKDFTLISNDGEWNEVNKSLKGVE